MANTISTTIALEGGREIARILEQIGDVGAKAMAEIAQATAEATERLANVADSVRAAENAVKRLGEAGQRFAESARNLGQSWGNFQNTLGRVARNVVIVSGVITGAAASFAFFVRSSSQAADDILKSSQSLGLTVEQYQRLSFAASQAGVDQQQFARSIARLSDEVQKGVQQTNRAVFEFADELTKNMQRAHRNVIDVSSSVGVSIKQIGEVARTVQQLLRAQGIDLPFDQIFVQLQRMANGTDAARKQFRELASGAGVGLARSALQKFGLATDSAIGALQRLEIRLVDIRTAKARGLQDILGDLAERFAGMPDGIDKTAAAVDLFGQRIGPRLIPLLNQGRAGIRATMDEFSRSTTGFTTAQAQAAEVMNDSFSSLFTTFRDVRNQLAVPLFQPLSEGARAIQETIQQSRGALEEFGRTIAEFLVPIIRDFVLLIQGRTGEIQNSFIAQLPALFQQAATTIRDAFQNIILPAFNGIMAALNGVAAAINAVFGTELTGAQVGVALAVAKILGLFGLLVASASLIASTFVAAWAALSLGVAAISAVIAVGKALAITLAALLGWPVLFVAAMIALGVAVALQWDKIRDTAIQAWNQIGQAMSNAFQFAVNIVQGIIDGLARYIDSSITRIIQTVMRLVETIKAAAAAVSSFFTGNAERGGSTGAPDGFATGGRVHGRGTTTSDSILARLSTGEYVIRAAAVRKYGAGLFDALNKMRLPRGGLPQFNMGGLVDGMNRSLMALTVPTFAAGGLVPEQAMAGAGQGRPVTIVLPDGKQITGLTAIPAAIDDLQRYAIRAQVRSAGKRRGAF